MKVIIKYILLVLAIIGIAVNASAKTRSDEVIIGVWSDNGPLDFATTTSAQSLFVARPAYERLVKKVSNPITGEIEYLPDVAKSWRISKDKKNWTFELNKDRKFSDGKTLTAEAIIFTFERVKAIGLGPSSLVNELIEDIESIDDYTVKFRLKKTSSLFLPMLADHVASIVNPNILKHQVEEDWGRQWLAYNTAGSGPYYLKKYVPKSGFIYELNPYYRNDNISIKRLIYKEIPEPSIRALQIAKGDIDIAIGILNEHLIDFESNNEFEVLSEPALLFKNLAMNTNSELLSNVQVRRAISHAIDYEAITKIIFQGRATPLRTPIPKGFAGYRENIKTASFNSQRAKTLLKESQVKLPEDPISLIYPNVSPSVGLVCTMIQANLKTLGIEVELQGLTIPAMLNKIDSGNYDLVYMGWVTPSPEPELILDYWFNGEKTGSMGNYARYNDAKVNELLRELKESNDKNQKRLIIHDIVDKVNSDVPYVHLVQNHLPIVIRTELENMTYNPFDLEQLNIHKANKNY